jgi:hypothetical protein
MPGGHEVRTVSSSIEPSSSRISYSYLVILVRYVLAVTDRRAVGGSAKGRRHGRFAHQGILAWRPFSLDDPAPK